MTKGKYSVAGSVKYRTNTRSWERTKHRLKKPHDYRLPRRHLFLIVALHRHATKIHDGHPRRCEIYRYGTRYIVHRLYLDAYGRSQQNKNATLGHASRRTWIVLTVWPVYIRPFVEKELKEKRLESRLKQALLRMMQAHPTKQTQ